MQRRRRAMASFQGARTRSMLFVAVVFCLQCRLSGCSEDGGELSKKAGRRLLAGTDTDHSQSPAAEKKIAMIKAQLDASEIRQLEKDIQHQLAKVGEAKTALSSLHVIPRLNLMSGLEKGRQNPDKKPNAEEDVSAAAIMKYALSQDKRRQSRYQEELERSRAAEKIEHKEFNEMHKLHSAEVARATAAEEEKEKEEKEEEIKNAERKEEEQHTAKTKAADVFGRGLGIFSHGKEEAAAWKEVEAKQKRFEAGLKELTGGGIVSGRGRDLSDPSAGHPQPAAKAEADSISKGVSAVAAHLHVKMK